MSNKTTMETLNIAKEIGSNLITRNSMKTLFEKIARMKAKKVCVDFTDTSFISRSSADEYTKLKKASSKTICEKNMPSNLEKMFEVASLPKEDMEFNFRKLTVCEI